MGRIVVLAFVVGTAAVQALSTLPGSGVYAAWGLLVVLWLVLWWRRFTVLRRVALIGVGFSCGVVSATLQAQWRLDDALAELHHNEVSRLVVQIIDLPQGDARSQRFLVRAEPERPAGIPERFSVVWQVMPGSTQALPDLAPGQRWRMALVLRHRHAGMNPHGPDQEGRWFALGLRASATVRGTPQFLSDEPWSGMGVAIERVRFQVRQGMRQALGDGRYAAVLIALAMGDQAGVSREDWQVFNRSGITHLVSISGMHVTLMAALGASGLGAVWRRVRWRGVDLAQRCPAQVVAAIVGFWIALLYCLLAGWGIPARRTFFMLAVVVAAALSRLPLSPSRILLCAAALVCFLDPWAVLAPGFWLSFGAVAILLRASSTSMKPRFTPRSWGARLRQGLHSFTHLQMAITVGLTPLLAFWVQQVSLGSPLANAVAIPVVSFIVTPLALACAMLSVIPGMQWAAYWTGAIAHWVFDSLMIPVGWVGRADWASLYVAAAPWPLLLLALVGVAWALQPAGWPARAWAWCLILPMLAWRPERPQTGDWVLTALDVGQGSAIVIETASKVLLFDAGPYYGEVSDAGERVVAPFLRAQGHRRLDAMVVSHADLDHLGGVRSVLAALPVHQSYASFELDAQLRREARLRPEAGGTNTVLPVQMARCVAGDS